MKTDDLPLPAQAPAAGLHPDDDADESWVTLADILTWVGEGKRLVGLVTLAAAVVALGVALLLSPVFTARTTLLAPNTQQQGGSAAALAALGALGGLGGVAPKTPDDLYVALLKSDSVLRLLDERFDLKKHFGVKTFEALRKAVPGAVRVSADKKSGLITVEVDDESAKFAADLANAHAEEVTRVLARLAVSEAQLRRVFFENQLKETKENLVKAEQQLQATQEKSGMIVLDKQTEALIGSAALLRSQIAEREVQLKVLRTSATEQNPDVQRIQAELRGLRTELERLESSQNAPSGNPLDLPVTKIPAAAIDYIRARRELKIQETLLESMLRQYEIAKLDEAKEGPTLQQVDKALPPDYKSKP
ncbi:MAG TPA: Wzz/FepE/Etk N-terminal domain-containing protein, partial [Caldimonas sp.]|nr:Wzz/FepE/Etk N-terminal domain-containing protein [Caldimonas sp.]